MGGTQMRPQRLMQNLGGGAPPRRNCSPFARPGGITPTRRSSCNQFQDGGGVYTPRLLQQLWGGVPPPQRAEDICTNIKQGTPFHTERLLTKMSVSN